MNKIRSQENERHFPFKFTQNAMNFKFIMLCGLMNNISMNETLYTRKKTKKKKKDGHNFDIFSRIIHNKTEKCTSFYIDSDALPCLLLLP